MILSRTAPGSIPNLSAIGTIRSGRLKNLFSASERGPANNANRAIRTLASQRQTHDSEMGGGG